jgi:hypothetical protein
MARDSRGRFTARRRTARNPGRRFAGPVEGTEENGVVTGEPIVLGGETAPATRETKTTKS